MTMLASPTQAKKQHAVPSSGSRSAAPATAHEVGPASGVVAASVASARGDADGSAHASVLSDPRLAQRTSAVQRARLVRQLQRGTGNARVARVMRQLREQTGGAA
ncbi:MAG TPA: hypothetical protein VKP00_00070, partial [Gemmatimonadaceae bacterium]|nr:hypothetical protein [Gemmatimonadaceae bacterium]